MRQLDFYLLPDVPRSAQLRFACRLCATAAPKIVEAGRCIHVHTPSRQAAEDFDALLWDYPPQRFLPHGLLGEHAAEGAPVVIGWAPDLEEGARTGGLLINLTDEIPAFIGEFERGAEILVEENRQAGRDRYRRYKAQGYALAHHRIDNWEGA